MLDSNEASTSTHPAGLNKCFAYFCAHVQFLCEGWKGVARFVIVACFRSTMINMEMSF